jgi:large subunit ribosomal protein L35
VPKMKSHRGAAKRIKPRKGGTFGRGKATATHNLTSKSSKRKMHLRKSAGISHADTGRVNRMLAT